jgi:hypothetical protein
MPQFTFENPVQYLSVTIANNAQVSSAVDLGGYVLSGLILPATFTSTAITFQMGNETQGTYFDIYDSTNTQLSMTVTQGRSYLFQPSDFVGVRYLKIKSGSAEGGARTVTLIARAVQ